MSPQLRIATLNLFNFVEPPWAYYDAENIYSDAQWQEKLAWTERALERLVPDCIGFQEVFSPQPLQTLCASQGLEHFAMVQWPDPEPEAFIRDDPRLALASRYPFISVEPVSVCPVLTQALGLPEAFAFSRVPIRAVVQVPGFGPLRLYVVHLKSPRPAWEAGALLDTPPTAEALLVDAMAGVSVLGRWASAVQRGHEAAMLYQDWLTQQQAEPLPTVLLGDFNDELYDSVLSFLLGPARAPLLPPGLTALAPTTLERTAQAYRLQDAHALALEAGERPPTHYWGPQGRVLDHLLLSAQFDPSFDHSLAQVDWVEVLDSHLVRNDAKLDRMCSDHAAVLAQLSVRR
ncbi:endonuclease/exonuclease/phosphatase family protein [Ferrimonas balearica]|uniref:endonuclease/exonuclease/phosphatase family protein n=1 Tax=Ferrimonas balearica TaxID=44012 RepID=UPI001C9913FB|nr:endonuclease/exonuclease/phosphatase family protein [Ferrimonas balearica]MBY5991340.1 endonuclease/exonuclease/phosphatase family protein [Ferrimonas balearica]